MGKSRIQCLDRTLDILEAIAAGGEMGAAELAAETGLKPATVHNILVTLAMRHYLASSKGRYSLGPGMAMLASQWSPAASLRLFAPPRLEAIAGATGESAVAAVLTGLKIVLVATTSGSDEIVVRFPTSVYPYPLSLATGRLLAAFADERIRDEIIRLHVNAKIDTTSESEWNRILASMVRTESCIFKFNGDSGHYSVSALVKGANGIVIGALGVYSPGFKCSKKHIDKMLASTKKEAGLLSEQLGG